MIDQQPHVEPIGLELVLAVVVVGGTRHEVVRAHRRPRRASRVARLLLFLLGARHRTRLVEHDHHVLPCLDRVVELVGQHRNVS